MTDDWSEYNVPQLRKYAADNEIELGQATRRSEIIEVIERQFPADDVDEQVVEAPEPEPGLEPEASPAVEWLPMDRRTAVSLPGLVHTFIASSTVPERALQLLQEALAKNGLYSGTPTGVLDTATREGVVAAHERLNVIPEDVPSRPLLEVLGFVVR